MVASEIGAVYDGLGIDGFSLGKGPVNVGGIGCRGMLDFSTSMIHVLSSTSIST